MAVTVRLTLQLVLGDPITGLWCDHCSLPSVVEVPIHTLSQLGVSSGSTVTQCLTPGCHDARMR
jgi:hypothetical protein